MKRNFSWVEIVFKWFFRFYEVYRFKFFFLIEDEFNIIGKIIIVVVKEVWKFLIIKKMFVIWKYNCKLLFVIIDGWMWF